MSEPSVARGEMSFRDHLVELRDRTLRAAVALVIAFFVAWAFHVELYELLSAPVREAMAANGLYAIKALQLTESIAVYMKLSLVGAVFLASPVLFAQIWLFVAPGLLDSERRLAAPVIAASVFFFCLGALFCYAVVLPFMTDFLVSLTLAAPGMTMEPTLQSTFSFSLWLLLAFGLIFELPVVLYFMTVLGLVSAAGLFSFYRYWIVISFVIGAVLTPTPDPINQALMSGPLVLLYGLGAGIAWLVELDRKSQGASWRAVLVLVALASVASYWGVSRLDHERAADPAVAVPADVDALTLIQPAALPARLQQAGDQGPAWRGLSALPLLSRLAQYAPADTTPAKGGLTWLVRHRGGVALMVSVGDAEGFVRAVATRMAVSASSFGGHLSALFAGPDEQTRWRAVAITPTMLWFGTDKALEALVATAEGGNDALVADEAHRELVGAARLGSATWALARGERGKQAWLPDGALADIVETIVADLSPDGRTLTLRYTCRGPDAAGRLRDALDTWGSRLRKEARAAAHDAKTRDARDKPLRRRLKTMALLLARLSATAARTLPQGSRDRQAYVALSAEASTLARDVDDLVGEQPAEGAADGVGASPFAEALLPPARYAFAVDDAITTLTIEGEPPVLLGAVFALPSPGVSDRALRAWMKPKADDGDADSGDTDGGDADGGDADGGASGRGTKDKAAVDKDRRGAARARADQPRSANQAAVRSRPAANGTSTR